jgi:hypothetical protein
MADHNQTIQPGMVFSHILEPPECCIVFYRKAPSMPPFGYARPGQRDEKNKNWTVEEVKVVRELFDRRPRVSVFSAAQEIKVSVNL